MVLLLSKNGSFQCQTLATKADKPTTNNNEKEKKTKQKTRDGNTLQNLLKFVDFLSLVSGYQVGHGCDFRVILVTNKKK